MKINKLVLKNFRSYEDKTTFDLATDSNKNIILIGGKNGAGKSTIFEAIKLCIYGPMAYRYQGFNASYIAKVKSNINNNALKNNSVNAFISVDLEINENLESNIYTLVREWTFSDKKLDEHFKVYKNFSDTRLTEEELDYFENYITSIISPEIFEFFFFDGEHLSEFFIGRNSNKHLKQSLLSLCNFDTFDILKNTIISSVKSDKNSATDIEKANLEYLNFDSEIKRNHIELEELNEKYQIIADKIEFLETKKTDLEKKFRSSGGILAEERDSLNKKIIFLESRRSIINQEIKDFCNEILPFIILKSKVLTLKNQVDLEINSSIYLNLKNKLNSNFIKNIINDKLNSDSIDEISSLISDALIDDLKPDNYTSDFKPIHNLSSDEGSYILSFIQNMLNFKNDSILNLFEELRDISLSLSEIRKKLNFKLENDSLNKYLIEISNLSSEIGKLVENRDNISQSIDYLKDYIDELSAKSEKAKERYISLLQADNIVDLSSNIILMLEDIIKDLTDDKVTQIQNNFMYIFKRLIQKNNFIDYIDIDSEFNISLYINKIYYSAEIENLIENIGYDEIYKKFGHLFFNDLFEIYNINEKSDILKVLKNRTEEQFLKLRTKVNVNEFSSGEKQIYILCLYWALIKSSDVKIPFIIDTPFARIDETHRNNITKEYFSTISDQVIILSTNTEIDKKSYDDIKPTINNEYIIKYDDINRKTIQNKGYFFEV